MVGLTALWSWRWALILLGVVGMLFALLLWTQGKLLDDDIHMRQKRLEEKKQRKEAAGQAAESGDVIDGIGLLLSLPIMMCFVFFAAMTLGFTGLRTFFVAAMDLMYGTPLISLNAALSGVLAGSARGILAGGMVADRFGARIGTAIVTLVVAGALVVLVGLTPLPLFWLITVLTASGFLQGVLLPTRDLLIKSVTPDGSMGKVMGFLSSGTMLASGVVPLLFGWILDVADPSWVFWISAIFITGALFSFVTARESSSGG